MRLTDGGRHVVLVTRDGQAVRFTEDEVRVMGRAASGVRAMRLGEGDAVVGTNVSDEGGQLLVVTERGYGKRTPLVQYGERKRGGKGVRALRSSEKVGPIAAACLVGDDSEVAIASAKGVVIRLSARHVPLMSRNTQGSRVIDLKADDEVVSVAHIAGDERDSSGGQDGASVQESAGSSSKAVQKKGKGEELPS